VEQKVQAEGLGEVEMGVEIESGFYQLESFRYTPPLSSRFRVRSFIDKILGFNICGN
jgi:hypothetical protein